MRVSYRGPQAIPRGHGRSFLHRLAVVRKVQPRFLCQTSLTHVLLIRNTRCKEIRRIRASPGHGDVYISWLNELKSLKLKVNYSLGTDLRLAKSSYERCVMPHSALVYTRELG